MSENKTVVPVSPERKKTITKVLKTTLLPMIENFEFPKIFGIASPKLLILKGISGLNDEDATIFYQHIMIIAITLDQKLKQAIETEQENDRANTIGESTGQPHNGDRTQRNGQNPVS